MTRRLLFVAAHAAYAFRFALSHAFPCMICFCFGFPPDVLAVCISSKRLGITMATVGSAAKPAGVVGKAVKFLLELDGRPAKSSHGQCLCANCRGVGPQVTGLGRFSAKPTKVRPLANRLAARFGLLMLPRVGHVSVHTPCSLPENSSM